MMFVLNWKGCGDSKPLVLHALYRQICVMLMRLMVQRSFCKTCPPPRFMFLKLVHPAHFTQFIAWRDHAHWTDQYKQTACVRSQFGCETDIRSSCCANAKQYLTRLCVKGKPHLQIFTHTYVINLRCWVCFWSCCLMKCWKKNLFW